MLNSELRLIKKDVFLHMFEEIHGYLLNYLDYGFVDLDHLQRSLHGKSPMFVSHLVFPMKHPAKSIYDLIKQLLATETGFSVSVLRERLAQPSDTRVSELMNAESFVNFIDVIYNATSRQMLLFNYELVYPFSERAARRSAPFPRGPNEIRVLSVHNPHEFYFQVLRDRKRDGDGDRDSLENRSDDSADWRYRCFVVLESATSGARGHRCIKTSVKEYEDGHICIDLVATDELSQSRSIFHELIRDGVVAFESR